MTLLCKQQPWVSTMYYAPLQFSLHPQIPVLSFTSAEGTVFIKFSEAVVSIGRKPGKPLEIHIQQGTPPAPLRLPLVQSSLSHDEVESLKAEVRHCIVVVFYES